MVHLFNLTMYQAEFTSISNRTKICKQHEQNIAEKINIQQKMHYVVYEKLNFL